MEKYDQERSEIEEFKRVYIALLTPVDDLKDTMAGYLPAFLTSLHSIKKLFKVEKHAEKVMKVIRSKIIEVIRTRVDEVLSLLKRIMLVRHVDRSIREKSIRAIKQMFKMTPSINVEVTGTKLPIYVIFILEREFKSSAVAKERMQCFKLMKAWLNHSPENFPLLFA